ncbi:MAG: RcnB family protein [Croceibacterium sp.]
MKFSQFATRGALGALTIALSVAALPASARPDDGEEDGPRQRAEATDSPSMTESRGAAIEQARQQRSEARADQAGGRQGREQAQPQQAQVQQPVQHGERQQWQGRQQDAQRQQWQARQQAQVEQGQIQQAERQQWQNRQQQQAQRQQWQGRQQDQQARQEWQNRQQRSRTYTDPNRSTTYGAYDRDRGSYGYPNDQYAYRDRDNRQWDRTWRNNSRYNWQRYRTTNRYVFNLGTYYSPYRNYTYRRFGVGSILQQLFYTNSYWINDPWQYRLPEVYGPYRWVRYYDDALLVDIYSGQVVDVIYDFFW